MKNGLTKTAISICLLTNLFSASVRAEVGKWTYYRAYHNARIVAETPRLIFAVYDSDTLKSDPSLYPYDGSLLSYNPEDGEVKLYSTQTGLSDFNIQYMAYSRESNALVLVYDNANIDIIAGENEIYNLPFIKDHPYIQNKTVHNLEIIGKYAYISTAFGIVIVDIDRRLIKDDCRLGNTRSVCLWGDYLLAATDEGIMQALASSNLLDKKNWQLFEEFVPGEEHARWVEKILVFKDRLIIHIWGNAYYLRQPEWIQELAKDVRQIAVIDNKLAIVSPGEVALYSDFDQVQRLPLDALSIDCFHSSGRYWVGLPNGGGLAAIDKRDNAAEYELTGERIKPNSPKRNMNFSMTFAAGKLLVVGGGRNTNRLNNAGTLMVYENGQWTNFDEKEIARDAEIPACEDFVSAVIDPKNPNRYFVGSWGEGLYEFVDNKYVNRYNHRNTNEKIQSSIPETDNFSRITGLVFDRNNNLFMVNHDVERGMVAFSADGKWENYYIDPLSKNKSPDKILIDRNNYKWLNIWRAPDAAQFGSGIVVLDPDNKMVGGSDKFFDQNDTDIGASRYLCMAEESNGRIWVGTDNGLIYFSSYQQVANGRCDRMISEDVYGTPFYLLENERINAIAIDGGNRKWLGSENSGVFLVEPSGNEIHVENFNTSNSPVLSNRINSIAINDETGEVFIGTDIGLCSYMSHVTWGKPDFSAGSSGVYAFPNPVRPTADTQVSITGLMQNSTVKITDMAGNLIHQGQSVGSLCTWNCTNRSGEIVKAGIYLVFAASSDGSSGIVTKIMVIQ
ncbi:MAG: hypothetical protein LBF08_01105 [Dysgonamonadaceae bacterium]|jgi:hypothetical protein|nr:hypothetical protein [Dysgonamonadaceae bacterium]